MQRELAPDDWTIRQLTKEKAGGQGRGRKGRIIIAPDGLIFNF